MKRALVAGGAGFIGSHLCDHLLAQNYSVTAIDCLVTGREENLREAIAKGLQFIQADINQPLHDIFTEPFDEIYNMASPASPVDFSRMPLFILDTAATGHRHLLELARAMKSRIFFASTSEIYGDPLVHPQPEGYFGNVNSIGPRSCYDEAKRFGEALSYSYHRQYSVEVRVGRIFNTYGSRMRPDDGRIIPNFFVQALQGQPLSVYGEGTQTRSFCYVTDLVMGIHKLVMSEENLPVNIGNPLENTVMEIAQTVNRLTGNGAGIRHLLLPENDPKQRCPDIAKAKRVLNWQPQVDLQTGLDICLKYFRAELANAQGRIETPVIDSSVRK